MSCDSGTDILYIPAIHKGYVDYLSKRDGEVAILNEALVRETPRLDRDIRALGSELVTNLVRTVVPDRRVTLLTAHNLGAFLKRRDADCTIFMPNEDVSLKFAREHLEPDFNVRFEPTFLRWDRTASITRSLLYPDRITTDFSERALMCEVDKEADASRDWWRQVGAAIVSDSEILLLGHNHPLVAKDYTLETFGDPRSNFDAGQDTDMQKNIHAEADLIAEAARTGLMLEGTDLYVTTFPCPVCAKSIAQAGIKRVYFRDGYSQLDAMDIFKDRGIETIQIARV